MLSPGTIPFRAGFFPPQQVQGQEGQGPRCLLPCQGPFQGACRRLVSLQNCRAGRASPGQSGRVRAGAASRPGLSTGQPPPRRARLRCGGAAEENKAPAGPLGLPASASGRRRPPGSKQSGRAEAAGAASPPHFRWEPRPPPQHRAGQAPALPPSPLSPRLQRVLPRPPPAALLARPRLAQRLQPL